MDNGHYVLIVDDDADARNILAKIMASLRVETRIAGNGREALNIIAQGKPALILLDLMMPVMNGFEVLFRLRSTPETRTIPVVVISAVSQDEYLKLPGVSQVIRKAGMRVADVQSLLASYVAEDNEPAQTDSPISDDDIQAIERISTRAASDPGLNHQSRTIL